MNSKEKALSHDRLLQLLEYNERTGQFIWKKDNKHNKVKGMLAGTIVARGYIHITINSKKYSAHRLVWFYKTGEWPYPQIDHIDRDKLNNRFDNLRVVTNYENSVNSPNWKGGNQGPMREYQKKYRKNPVVRDRINAYKRARRAAAKASA